ncbi:MAG: SPFH domain-containing protein [Petrotogales bacterium]
MSKKVMLIMCLAPMFTGCSCIETEVPQGTIGRVKTPGGWGDELFYPGYHHCWGRDIMVVADSAQHVYEEEMSILVGGKVNLRLTIAVRCRLDDSDKKNLFEIFERIKSTPSNNNLASIEGQQVYDTYLKLNVQSTPRDIVGSQPDVQTVVANRAEIGSQIKKAILVAAEATPLEVTDVEITNYDWPDSITKAQEKLVEIQLEEERVKAQVAADLRKAEGNLKVEEANKLVEIKKAEAIAESIEVIKEKLAQAPEYLQWHQVRVMSEAAQGPNNAFILIPYGAGPTTANVAPYVDKALMSQIMEDVLKKQQK